MTKHASDQWTNPDALTFERQVQYRRRPQTVGRLCWNGYHQPHFPGNDEQCSMVGCRCYCHHPREVASYAAREGKCGWCKGTGRTEALHPGNKVIERACPVCYGSGYGPGHIVTRAEHSLRVVQQGSLT